MNNLDFIYEMYHKDDIEGIFHDISVRTITTLANEVEQTKTKYKEGGPLDTEENAKKIIIAVADELAERIKKEIRIRIEKLDKLQKMMNDVEKQLDDKEELK